jgi:outer membrane protein assembly factor BamB
VKRVHAGNGLACDGHEFTITDRNTALLAIYNEVPVAGSPAVVEGVVQETDIATGKVLFEWHSLDHVPLSESFRPDVTAAGNIDYFHLNSIGVDSDGNLLISARHTSTVYKLDRKTGDIIWRLGGMKSDFTLGPGATFNFQHDARTHTDGTLTLFDNGATDLGAGKVEPHSRPMRLRLDTTAKTATFVQEYQAATPRLAFATGNTQQLADGNIVVDWGTAGAITEFTSDGTVVFDATLGGGAFSYRAFRLEWVGHPTTKPTVIVDGKTAYVSWNGATEVAYWQLLTGPSTKELAAKTTVAKRGFETAVALPASGYVAIAALDAKKKQLGVSAVIRP